MNTFCSVTLIIITEIIPVSNKRAKVKTRSVLKPYVRHHRVCGMGASGLMLIPVSHPTQCVAVASAGKRTRPGVHPQKFKVTFISFNKWSIQYE